MQLLLRKAVLFAEHLAGSVLFQFFRGEKYQCILCEKKLRGFISFLRSKVKICPYCWSRSSDRRLWLLLRPFIVPNSVILHFEPSAGLSRKLSRYPGIRYETAGFRKSLLTARLLNITSLDAPRGSYDLIICYNVLEQIVQDQKAMQELNRVLRSGGKCFIQSPFKKGMIYEDWFKTSPAERRALFGNENHVRIYSVDGLKARLQNSGFDVVSTRFVEAKDNYYGLLEEEYVVTALKH